MTPTSEPTHDMSPRPPRRVGTWTKVKLICFALLIGLVVSEVSLRLFVNVTDVAFMIWDPLVGPRRAPNQVGRYYAGNEIDGRYRFNAHGWNNIHDTYKTVKPKGTRRVCLVGDSMVEALNVAVEESMASVAERAMSRPDRPVEWYTFANSGYGTTHEYILIHHYALDFKPDVVVMFFVANDPVDSSIYMAPQEPWMAQMFLDDRGELIYVPPEQYIPSTLKRTLAKLALVRYFKIQKRVFERGAVPLAPGQMPVRAQNLVGSADALEKLGNLEERVARTWDVIEAVLKKTKEECEAHGAQFLLVYQGHRFEIEWAIEGKTYTPPAREVDPLCIWERINEMGRQYVEPIAKRQGIHYLDLTDALVAAVRQTGKRHNYTDDAHFNPFGHEVIGKAMAAEVERLLSEKAGD